VSKLLNFQTLFEVAIFGTKPGVKPIRKTFYGKRGWPKRQEFFTKV